MMTSCFLIVVMGDDVISSCDDVISCCDDVISSCDDVMSPGSGDNGDDGDARVCGGVHVSV